MIGFRYPTKVDKLQKPQAIRFCHNMACFAFGTDRNEAARKRMGTFIEFDFSDQIRDTRKDKEFAIQIAREYGVPVQFNGGLIR